MSVLLEVRNRKQLKRCRIRFTLSVYIPASFCSIQAGSVCSWVWDYPIFTIKFEEKNIVEICLLCILVTEQQQQHEGAWAGWDRHFFDYVCSRFSWLCRY